MTNIHQDLAGGRWFTMSLAEQLGNIGSEYDRACRAKEQNNEQRFSGALARFLELMDLTLADTRWHNHRLKELCRVREQACEELLGNNEGYIGSFKEYFLSFAILARAGV
jgi:hypothetical protein